jgi:hypothetical protein
VTGAVTANAGVSIDNITIDGTEIDLSSGSLTLDVAGGITFDADGGQIDFKDGGTVKALIDFTTDNVEIQARATDGDLIFRGQDGSSFITALTLDMSEAGAATFNGAVTVGGNLNVPQFIIHDGDTDTYIKFDDNTIRLFAGNSQAIDVASSGVIINQASADIDFRVESNGNTHMLFVDGGNDRVGIGMTPATDFHIKGVTTIDGDGSSRTEITSSTASSIVSLNVGGFDGTPSVARDLRFFTNAASNAKTEHMRISSSGNVLVAKQNTTFSDNGIELRGSNGGARFIRSNAEPILMNRTGSGGAILGMYQDGTIKGEIGVESTGITFNESGADLDFRVESNGNSHALFVDAGNDRVGVLTSAPDSTLHVSYTSSNANPLLEANAGLNLEGSSSVRMLFGSDQSSPFAGYIQASNTGSGFPIALNPSGGNVGIGTTNPGELLSVEGSGNTAVSINTGNNSGDNSQLKFGDSADDDVGQINYDHGTNAMQFRTNAGSNSIVIDSAGATTFSGNVKASDILASGSGGLALQTDDGVKRITLEDSGTITLGNNSLAAATTLNARRTGATGDILRITGGNSNVSEFGAILIHGENVTGGTQKGIITFNTIDVASVGDATLQERVRVTAEGPTRFVSGSSTVPGITFLNDTNTGFNNASADNIGFVVGGSQKAFLSASQFNVTGNGVFSGSISKGSGSFKIDHPLPSKTDTHHLVHSFVEAPQADNIYRGSVDLVGGSATVNIDTAAGMTDGTFVLLNTNVQCFTSNESGWTAIKGSVSGNTLTITAQDSDCTDTISWMVVGERHDQHMKDTEWTDSDGKVIVEPEKVSEGE